MVEIQILPKGDVSEWVYSLHSTRPGMAMGLLLSGDRWSCVEEVTVAKIDGEIAGIITIAPEGEEMSGKPTIVAIYVLKEHRASGVGYQLFEATIDYMSSKDLIPIHVDAMNSKVLRMIDRLPIEKRQKLNVVDQTMGGAMDAMLDG